MKNRQPDGEAGAGSRVDEAVHDRELRCRIVEENGGEVAERQIMQGEGLPQARSDACIKTNPGRKSARAPMQSA
ncbi:MAG: hypothetical protein WDN49_26495 [Acetobacteraceae bacterium]